jgi:hypothetical protein
MSTHASSVGRSRDRRFWMRRARKRMLPWIHGVCGAFPVAFRQRCPRAAFCQKWDCRMLLSLKPTQATVRAYDEQA